MEKGTLYKYYQVGVPLFILNESIGLSASNCCVVHERASAQGSGGGMGVE